MRISCKTLTVILFALLGCGTCLGQSSYKGLTPGKSTRANVERVLGLPVKKISETLVEYRPQPLTGKIFVQYRTNSTVVERIEVSCRLENSNCNDFAKNMNLRLPKTPETARVPENGNEKSVLYYGSPLYVVATYGSEGGAESMDVLTRLGFYSPELYASAVQAVNERNAQVERATGDPLNTGNAASNTDNSNEASKQSDVSLATAPTRVALLTNKAAALKARGIERYNAAIVSKDDQSKRSGLDAAKTDFKDAVDTANQAIELLKQQPATTKEDKYSALAVRADAFRLFVTTADPTQVNAGISAYQDYLAVETAPAKRAQAQHSLAQMLFDANEFALALVQYRKILATNPEDLVAVLRSGQALFTIGAINNDKTKYQDAANYIQRFLDNAPDTDSQKNEAKAILDVLKSENIVPRRP